MPSKEPVALVSYRRTHSPIVSSTHNPIVVPPREQTCLAAGYSKGHSSLSLTSRNHRATGNECARLRPGPHGTIFHSDDISKLSYSLSDSSPSEAGNQLNLHSAKSVSKVRSDTDSIRSHEQPESEPSSLNVTRQGRKLQRERRDMQISEHITVTNCEWINTKRCVQHRSCEGETNSESVGSETTATVDVDKVSGDQTDDSDGDSTSGSDVKMHNGTGSDIKRLSATGIDVKRLIAAWSDVKRLPGTGIDAKRLSATGSVTSLDAQFIDENESAHSLGETVELDSPGAVVDTGGDLHSNDHSSDASTSSRDSPDTLDDSWLRQYILTQDVSHDLSHSTSQDPAGALSHDRASMTPPQNRCRPSQKLDLHHGLRSDRGDSDDDDDDVSFCCLPRHVSGYGSDDGDDDDDDNDDDDVDDDDDYGSGMSLTSSQLDLFAPMYAMGELRHSECSVCLEMHPLHVRACCEYAACDDCLARYYAVQVASACVRVQCVGCDAYVPRDELIARLDDDSKRQFGRFLVDANRDPCVKTCPRCGETTHVDSDVLRRRPERLRVTCPACRHDWCFPCQAPWHEGATCRQYRKGDRQLRIWARQHQGGQVNARKCPKCKVSRPFCFFLVGR